MLMAFYKYLQANGQCDKYFSYKESGIASCQQSVSDVWKHTTIQKPPGECIPPPRHIIINKCENPDPDLDCDSDQWDLDCTKTHLLIYFHEDQARSICIILQPNIDTDITSFAEVIKLSEQTGWY